MKKAAVKQKVKKVKKVKKAQSKKFEPGPSPFPENYHPGNYNHRVRLTKQWPRNVMFDLPCWMRGWTYGPGTRGALVRFDCDIYEGIIMDMAWENMEVLDNDTKLLLAFAKTADALILRGLLSRDLWEKLTKDMAEAAAEEIPKVPPKKETTEIEVVETSLS